jgi:hypothetical protein
MISMLLQSECHLIRFVSQIRVLKLNRIYVSILTASVVWWSEFMATDQEVPGSIPGHYKKRK